MSTAVENPKPSRSKSALVRASVNPVNLGVGAGAAVLAIGLGSLPLGLLGGLAYLAMVAYDAMSPAGRPRTRSAPLVHTLPDPKDITDADTRAAVTKIIASRAELERVLDETPPEVIANLSTTLASLQQLEGYAARLVTRAEDITRHLAGVDVSALVTEVKQLAQRAQDASQPGTRNTFEEAKAARMDEIRTLKELGATREKIIANLMRVVAVLGALPTKVVHMRALDAQAMDRISGDMNAELEAVGNEIKTSEEVIKNLGEVTQ